MWQPEALKDQGVVKVINWLGMNQMRLNTGYQLALFAIDVGVYVPSEWTLACIVIIVGKWSEHKYLTTLQKIVEADYRVKKGGAVSGNNG